VTDEAELVRVKGGCFRMGNPLPIGGPEEKPVHEVCVDDFYIGKLEVTQGQWKRVMGDNPSSDPDCGADCPVDGVSWDDVQVFLGRLNAASGGPSAGTYRLPSEAEWEYAARSGGKDERFSGRADDDLASVAWHAESEDFRGMRPVGLKAPNGLGLHDMTGNVWEWTNDWYASGYYSSSPRDNPPGPSSGEARVLRGGGFRNDAFDLRTTYRNYLPPGYRGAGKGFRVARTAPAQAR
jgi:formylglycine-generating enzyme required for sulfatase activity